MLGTKLNRRYYPRRWFYPVLALLSAVTFTLATPTVSHALNWAELIIKGIQVVQLSSMSDKQEVELGKQINDQVTQEVRILRNAEVTNYVNQIGQRLATKSDRPNLPYTFQVVDDDGINAFATAGGFVYVNKGLLKTADNEAQLASVIGHEIGHITGKHALKQMREAAVAQGLIGAAGLKRSAAVQIGVELALRRPHSRRDEFDADRRGLINLSKAGYAQSEMVAFMQKLLSGKSSIPTFLSTHPNTADRVAELKKQIDKAPTNGKDGLDGAGYKSKLQALR
ncbi:M48 family metallopeptidase [Alkalinema sp. FACHB-956]|uniref:M48 family metallopeptidase n=1 Tax=Alkalinema sp. FACHB-956 TaxID=2692768 RepID=UPI001685FCAB|nr:M48 family metallopeptidase [Alkalinema sp. FACHB-956]MBD2327577.1 M48 family metalloprotease [Alkalinema sp. FACHB-956]